MPVNLPARANEIWASERHLSVQEQIERWTGRKYAAQDWARECEHQLSLLRTMSQFEMDVVVEAATPPEAGPEPLPRFP